MSIKTNIIEAYCVKHSIGIVRLTPTNHNEWEFSLPNQATCTFNLDELKNKINKSSKIKVTIDDLIETFNEDILLNDTFVIPPLEYQN